MSIDFLLPFVVQTYPAPEPQLTTQPHVESILGMSGAVPHLSNTPFLFVPKKIARRNISKSATDSKQFGDVVVVQIRRLMRKFDVTADFCRVICQRAFATPSVAIILCL